MSCPNNNTRAVCGTFTTPVNEDKGCCSSYRVQKDCEAPVVPAKPCNDTSYSLVYDPDLTPPWRINTSLVDENCQPVLDELGNTIIVTLV
jgi:hypothetical protein